MADTYTIPPLPLPFEVETKTVLKQLNSANRQLAELKGLVQRIPNEAILLNTLSLQEARDSSSVENIVTTTDDLYVATLGTMDADELDPLIRMAIIHHQFESIHPFYDGNGRTGRILSILLLVANNLLDLPILYLSRYITHNKNRYYQLIQEVRESTSPETAWQAWILFLLNGIEETSRVTIRLVKRILELMDHDKQILRPLFGRIYKHELINHLFSHPYTKVDFMEAAMNVQRNAATRYLERIVGVGLLTKVKRGRTNYYINERLVNLLTNPAGELSIE